MRRAVQRNSRGKYVVALVYVPRLYARPYELYEVRRRDL